MTVTPIHAEEPHYPPQIDDRIGTFADADVLHTSRVATAIEGVVLIAVATADVVQFEQVAESVFVNAGTTLATMFAVGATAASTWAMFQSGALWRRYQAGEAHPPYLAVALLTGAWLVCGLFMAGLRWSKEQLTLVDPTLFAELSPAAAFLALYLLSGALAWHLGNRVTNPRATALRNAARARRKAVRKVAETGRDLDFARNERERLVEGISRDEERFNAAVATRMGQEAELKALARELISQAEADPPSTVAITGRD